MADSIVLCAIVIAALSSIWRRLYIGRFWVRGRGTAIQVNVEYIETGEGGWTCIWTPTIEYYADGRRWVSQFGLQSECRVGDQFDILYNPRKPWRCSYVRWWPWIFGAMMTGLFGIIFGQYFKELAMLLANYFASAS
jgi:hypothetical protein